MDPANLLEQHRRDRRLQQIVVDDAFETFARARTEPRLRGLEPLRQPLAERDLRRINVLTVLHGL